MTTQYELQAETILKASRLGQLPGHVRTAAHDGLANSREATLKSIGLVKTLAAKVSRQCAREYRGCVRCRASHHPREGHERGGAAADKVLASPVRQGR